MTNCELNFAALESCLQTLDHLFIEIGRLKSEPEYEEKRGGYGDVRVATLDPRTPTSRLVATKTIRLKARNKEPQRIAFRLARELRVWARLQHPHVLPLLGYFLDKDYKIAVLISEYMIHGDLKDYIEQKRPAWGARLQLIRDATDGLAYLHGQNPPILHGDLKTGNVLINADLRASLADFGLSKALQAGSTGLTTSDGLKGTLRYYSPEVVSESNPDRCLPSDIWAWACLALEALTDTLPYAKKNTETAILIALMKSEIPIDIESLPIPIPDLKLLLAKCWAITPIERPSAAYCLRILNSVSPSSQISIHVGKSAVQGSSKQPGFRTTDSSASPTNIGSGARPQINADSGSRRNGEESGEKYEEAEPSGSSKGKFRCCNGGFKTLQAVGPASNSVPSQLNVRIPQQRQAPNKESKARPGFGSALTQSKPRRSTQTSRRTQIRPSFDGYDAYATLLSFGPPLPVCPPFQTHFRPDERVPLPLMQYGAFQSLPAFPGPPRTDLLLDEPHPTSPFLTGLWPPYDQSIFGLYLPHPPFIPPTRLAYDAPGGKQSPHTSTNAATSLQVPETLSTIARRKRWTAAKKLHKRKKDALRSKLKAERWEQERRERERRTALRHKRNPEGKDLHHSLEAALMALGVQEVERECDIDEWEDLSCPDDGGSIYAFPAAPRRQGRPRSVVRTFRGTSLA